jgi:sulfite dehydrogenase (cytochrome) subunit B
LDAGAASCPPQGVHKGRPYKENKVLVKRKRCPAWLTFSLGLMVAVCLGARATEKSIKLPDDNAMAQLKPGPNVDVVRKNCIVCHSTDYIVRQPGSDAKKWESEVRKMIKVYGAPISEADAKVIVEYLATAYGENGEKGKKGRP